MNKVLHSEDGLIIGLEEDYLKARSSKSKITVDESAADFRLIKQFSIENSIDRLMIAIVDTPELPDNYTELFVNTLSEEELSFFYDVKIALVSFRKYFKMFQLHVQFAKSINVDIDVFLTMKEAKVWLLQEK